MGRQVARKSGLPDSLCIVAPAALVLVGLLTPVLQGQIFSWDGGGDGLNWSDDDNWGANSPSPGGGDDDTLLFIIDSPLWASINDLSGTFVVSDVFFTTSGVNATLASLEGNPIQFDGQGRELEFDGGGALAISNPLSFASGPFTTVDVINTTGGADPTLRLNGNLSGVGQIFKTGGGRLVLAGNNASWGASLFINEGNVLFEPGDALSNDTTVTVSSSGTANFTPEAENFGALSGSGTVLIGSGEVQAGFNNAFTLFSGVLTATNPAGSFAKAGTGTMSFVFGAEVNVSLLRSRGGGTLRIANDSQVTADLIDAIELSTVRIEDNATVFATAADFSNTGTFELNGGTLITSAFNGVLLNQGGTLSPGTLTDSTRILPISDNFNNSVDSTLVMDVGGLTPGDHDQLSLVVGPPGTGKFAGLGGTLDVNLVDGFSPDLGDTFKIVVARSIGGAFEAIDAPIFNGMTFDVSVVNIGPNEMHAVLEVVEFTALPADFDMDGDVDNDDLAIWEAAYGVNDLADADGDGDSDGEDFLAWQEQFTGSLPLTAAAVVPEPATLWLAFIALTVFSNRHFTNTQCVVC